MIHRILLAFAVCLSFVGRVAAVETLVKDVAEFDVAMKEAKPGDEIVLADGEWRDAKLVVRFNGESEKPITVRAETPGRVVFVGRSTLRIGGKHLVVRDFHWKDCEAESEVIAFRVDSKNHASFCKLQSCAVIGDRPTKGDRKWVSIYGEENLVSRCRFDGKQSAGTLMVVWLAEDQPSGSHEIRENFFGPRSKLGKNGGEILRVGDSKTSMQFARTWVEANYFYRCDGEAEIISNKSGDNHYENNVFVGCGGALTLRHGNLCTVGGNAFFGDGRKGTGGVRIIGEGHEVDGNLFHGLEGDHTRAAVSLMNGIPDSPANGYFQVRNADVAFNIFIDCKESLVVGLSDDDRKDQSLAPEECMLMANVVLCSGPPVFIMHDSVKGLTHGLNYFHGGRLGIDDSAAQKGWTRLDARPALDQAKLEISRVTQVGHKFELRKIAFEQDRKLVRPGDVGPAWMRPGDEYLPAVLKPSAENPAK